METGGVGQQWTKRLVLESAVPPHVHNDLDDLFDEGKLGCGQIYHRCKELLLELHGPRPERDIELALAMVVPPGQAPSQTAQRLVKLICKEKKPLVNCCCANLVSTRWRQLIPQQVKTHVSGLDFKTQYVAIMKVADNVWRSLQPGQQQVAPVQVVPVGQDALAAYEVAGVAYGRGDGQRGGRSRGGRRGRG